MSSAEPRPPAVAAYLDDIAARIPRWRHARRALLAELADGLDDAVAHYQARGLALDAAADQAVNDCGPAAEVAAAFSETLAGHQARHTALTLLATGPLLGALWLAAATPDFSPTTLLLGHPLIGVLVTLAALAAGLTIGLTGRAAPWLAVIPASPAKAAALACLAAAVCDVALLAGLLEPLTRTGAHVWAAAMPAAAAASMVRLTLTQRVARRDLRTVTPSG